MNNFCKATIFATVFAGHISATSAQDVTGQWELTPFQSSTSTVQMPLSIAAAPRWGAGSFYIFAEDDYLSVFLGTVTDGVITTRLLATLETWGVGFSEASGLYGGQQIAYALSGTQGPVYPTDTYVTLLNDGFKPIATVGLGTLGLAQAPVAQNPLDEEMILLLTSNGIYRTPDFGTTPTQVTLQGLDVSDISGLFFTSFGDLFGVGKGNISDVAYNLIWNADGSLSLGQTITMPTGNSNPDIISLMASLPLSQQVQTGPEGQNGQWTIAYDGVSSFYASQLWLLGGLQLSQAGGSWEMVASNTEETTITQTVTVTNTTAKAIGGKANLSVQLAAKLSEGIVVAKGQVSGNLTFGGEFDGSLTTTYNWGTSQTVEEQIQAPAGMSAYRFVATVPGVISLTGVEFTAAAKTNVYLCTPIVGGVSSPPQYVPGTQGWTGGACN
jgi:hypothetical protein